MKMMPKQLMMTLEQSKSMMKDAGGGPVPWDVDSLTPDSNDKIVQDAISSSIQQCMQEGGRDQKECAAIAYSKARKSTGRDLGFGSQSA